jgi:CHAT domain-containing protein/tetratricopeptide (TPR) repeat protein
MPKFKRSHLKLLAFLTLLTTVSTSLSLNPWASSSATQILAQTSDARKAEADRLLEQGIQQYRISQFEAAIQFWQQALIIYREIKDRFGEGRVLGNLGVTYKSLGDYAKAIDYQQQSLVIKREIKDRLGERQSLLNLGVAYKSLGDYTKAIEYYQHSLAIAREIKDRLGEGQSLGNLGNAYDALGDYAKAIEYQQQRLAITREIKDRLGEGQSLGNLGLAYYSLGDYAKTIEYYQQSLAIAREIKDRLGEGQSLGNLGNAYYSLGDYAKAIDYHQQSLAIAREIKDRLGEGQSLGNLGNAYYSLGDYAKAIDYLQKTLAIAREIGDKNGEGMSLNNLGVALFKTGNLTQAEKTLRTGIETWESQRARLGDKDAYKVSIFEEQARTYRVLQQVLIQQNQPNAALEVAERGRARAFLELLARRNATVDKPNLTSLKPTIPVLQQIAKQHSATLVEYSIITENFKVKGKEETHESELYIWTIQPNGEIAFRQVDLKPLWQQQNTTLAKLVTMSRDSLGVRGQRLTFVSKVNKSNLKQQLQQLHQLLISPIVDLLPKDPNQRVVFIPQQSLFLVPFAALQDADGKYLIEKHTILTSPAIQVLDLTHKQRQHVSGKDVLIVGNPTMPKIGNPPEQLPSLPGSEDEANAIAKLFNTEAITGQKASKAAFKQLIPNAKIIHLATHGLLDDYKKFGVPGAIALAPSGEDDGLLTSGEILDLKLNAELVVLSACNTGRGDIKGDGVIGLSRSLITAGTPSVLVSLWSVPDSPTASLMTEFYRQMQQKPDKAQALRQAMLVTKQAYPNPKDWAAFTLIGEAE